MKCGELANYENLSYFKLGLFPNSLIGAAFTWYAKLSRNFIMSWQEMNRRFHTQFFRVEPEICIEKLSRVTQRGGELIDSFISHFKRMRNRCKIHLLEIEYVEIAQRGLDIELRKKFQGMEFKDFYELIAKVIEYEELLGEENQRRNTSMGTYFQEVNYEEIAVEDLLSTDSFSFPPLGKKALDLWKKSQTSNTQVQYTFDVTKTREIFDFLLNEKFITFP